MPKVHQIGGNIAYVSWEDKEELLENNYRQTMKRDREDPEKGDDYVSKAQTELHLERSKKMKNKRHNKDKKCSKKFCKKCSKKY